MSAEHYLRVLVTFDCSHPDEAVLRQLAELLAAEALELTGLFVEDEDLLRAAALPGLREISLSGAESGLDPDRLARELARDAETARQTFQRLAQTLAKRHGRLRHRFLVTRGRTAEEIHRAAAEADFVLVTRALRASGFRPRLGRTFQELVRQPVNLMFVNEPWASGSSVVVLHGSPAALDYAARLAESEGLRLVVAVPAVEPADALPAGAVIRHLPDWAEERLADLCLTEDARLLVMTTRPDVDWAELLVSLMDRLPCSLLKLA
jgi:hypothetical protein